MGAGAPDARLKGSAAPHPAHAQTWSVRRMEAARHRAAGSENPVADIFVSPSET
jgi:hypothetical protein